MPGPVLSAGGVRREAARCVMRALARDGYCVCRGGLEPALLVALRAEAAKVCVRAHRRTRGADRVAVTLRGSH